MNISTLQIKELLVKTFDLELDPAQMSDDTKIIGDGLELDSVDVLEIISQVDKHFKIKVKGEDIKKNSFSTVGELTNFLNHLSSVQSGAAQASV